MITNLHTHTFRCHHASGTEREYIEEAIAKGLTTLGFSDHAPYPFPGDYYSGFRMRPEFQEDYVDTLTGLRDEYRGKIDIKIGYEAEYYPALFKSFTEMITRYDVDYMILGQHFLRNEYDGVRNYAPNDSEEALSEYVSQVIEGMDTGLFTYVAHPDLFNYPGELKIFDRHFSRLIEHSKDTGIPLELNLIGIEAGLHYPNEHFFELCGMIGAPVCLGCDAHRPTEICIPRTVEKAAELTEKYDLKIVKNPELRKVEKI